jgi:enterochelin esterase family protein
LLKNTLFLIALTAAAQEIHPDRRVTFSLEAPQAKEVSFFGDWMKAGAKEPMTKDAKGVWRVTVGPLEPNIYIYSFTVDGVTIADPVNPRMKLRARTSASLVEVPADTELPWQARDVPHGAVEINWQHAKAIGGEARAFWVYTPPGYAQSKKKYPVLYLFHGSNDTAGGWVLVGHANFILDNLIAAGKATPMIVVMPFGHAVPFGSPREVQAKNVTVFEDYILRDVMPAVEGKYRVTKDRAIAGLSMGGGQSIHIGLRHPEMFSALGAFSAAVPENAGALLNAAPPKLFWFACGRQDFLLDRNRGFDKLLTERKVKHVYRETEGPHTYSVWRQYLAEFVPLLFR